MKCLFLYKFKIAKVCIVCRTNVATCSPAGVWQEELPFCGKCTDTILKNSSVKDTNN